MRAFLLSCFIICAISGTVLAAEISPEEELVIYKFPEIKPKIFLTGGYRLIEIEGSERAAEFEYLRDSVIFAGEFRALPFPHRIHLELDFLNEKDYFWDASYAYKDLILSRWISRSIFHNLDNINLIDLGEDERFKVDRKDISKEYGIESDIDAVFMRFKAPDFPVHIYVDGRLYTKSGQRQQRFLGGSGFFNDLTRVAEKREVDHETRDIKVGVNTHMGPVEIDLSHSEKRFDAGGDRILHDFYAAGGGRAAGVYPHNAIPDFEGSESTLKLHTSYTGKIVASLTLSRQSKENESSGAEADYFLGSTDLTWMPMPKLTFFFKYRHRETDVENPDTVTITDLINQANSFTYNVRQSISSKKDSLSGNLRYRLFKGITLNAEISHINTDRENADEWNLPETTVRDVVALAINARVLKNVNIKSKYTHEEIDEPAYNVESDTRDKGTLSVSWKPLPFLFANMIAELSQGRRDDIQYTINDQQAIIDSGKRTEGKLLGMIGINISENIALDTSYAYVTNRTKQPLIYGSNSEPQFITDDDVLNKEKIQTVSTNVNYRPATRLDLSAGGTYTESTSDFFPGAQAATEPVSISEFSELKIRQTDLRFSGRYSFADGWDFSLKYLYSKFDDAIDRLFKPADDGEAHIILLGLTKRWQ
ncbi:MAG: MtrB/PioB family outer membrane beta-barrel protein [Nitrospirota bacterium]